MISFNFTFFQFCQNDRRFKLSSTCVLINLLFCQFSNSNYWFEVVGDFGISIITISIWKNSSWSLSKCKLEILKWKEKVWSAHRQTQVKALFLEGRQFQILCQNRWKYCGIWLCISVCDIMFLHEWIVNLLFCQCVSFLYRME